MNQTELLERLKSEPIINAHSHHLPDKEQEALTLQAVLRNSYVHWCGTPMPDTDNREMIKAWLSQVRFRGYFIWLEKALMALYEIDDPLDENSWATYDSAIRAAHRDPNWHLRILREKCKYEGILLDAYWTPGSDNGHPELFTPAYRVNSFLYGYNHAARDHNGNNIQISRKQDISDIDAYMAFISQDILKQKRAGCAALKCAAAYDRGLDFMEATKQQAQRAMTKNPDALSIRHFQDYVFDGVCACAAEIKLPVQIHTGLGLMVKSDAMRLQPLIARHPNTAFVLMHGSYPWTGDIAGLLNTYPNVWADLCWLPLISAAAALRLIHELIDTGDTNRMVWGCDTWTGEESFGARLAFLHVLSRALSERAEDGLMREKDMMIYARAVMRDNAARLFAR